MAKMISASLRRAEGRLRSDGQHSPRGGLWVGNGEVSETQDATLCRYYCRGSLNTNAFREDLAQYWNFQETRLLAASSSTITIVEAANHVLQRIYRQGYQYKKAGVIVMGIGADSPVQQDLFDINAEQFQKMKRLHEVIDRINRMQGSETIVLGSQQYTRKDGKGKADVFANAIKHDHRSPCPTTRWSEVIKLT